MAEKIKRNLRAGLAPKDEPLFHLWRRRGVKKISRSLYRNAPEQIFPGKVQEDVKLLPEALMEPYESEGTCRDSFGRSAA